MLSANFFLIVAALPTCLLWQAAGPGAALPAFLLAAAASLLFTLPSRTGGLFLFVSALATPLWLFAFVTECVSFYSFADGGRFFPDYPIAILIVFALCALLIGIRGRRGIERLSVLVGLVMLILALIALLAGGGRGETQKSLILLALPAVSGAACCTAAAKPNPIGALAGIGLSFLLYLTLYFAFGNALLTELAVLTGAIFRAAVLVYAALKTVIPRLSVH